MAEAYGVWGEKANYGRKYMGIIRSAFLVDEKGKVAEAWPKISPKDTPTKLLKALGSDAISRPAVAGALYDRDAAALPEAAGRARRRPAPLPGGLGRTPRRCRLLPGDGDLGAAGLPRPRARRQPPGWLFTIAHRKVVDHARRASPGPIPWPSRPSRRPWTATGWPTRICGGRCGPAAQAAHRGVQRHLLDRPYAEVAEVIGCSEPRPARASGPALQRLRRRSPRRWGA